MHNYYLRLFTKKELKMNKLNVVCGALKNEKDLYEISLHYDDMAIVKKMKEIVPEYRSRHSKYEVLD